MNKSIKVSVSAQLLYILRHSVIFHEITKVSIVITDIIHKLNIGLFTF